MDGSLLVCSKEDLKGVFNVADGVGIVERPSLQRPNTMEGEGGHKCNLVFFTFSTTSVASATLEPLFPTTWFAQTVWPFCCASEEARATTPTIYVISNVWSC